MSKYLVSKCICHKRSFSEIKEYAEAHGYTSVEELQSEKYCGCNCGLCIPYIKLMLKTGETEFEPGARFRVLSKE